MRNSSRNNVRPSVPRNVTWLSCLPLDVSKGLAGHDRWAHIHRLLRTGPRIICAEERCHDNKDRLWNDTLYQSDVERRKTNQLQFNEEWNWGKWKRKWKCVITCCTIVCACSLLIEAKEWALQIHYFQYIPQTHSYTCYWWQFICLPNQIRLIYGLCETVKPLRSFDWLWASYIRDSVHQGCIH